MATPNFFNGANLKIKVNGIDMAYATGISFQHNMATTGVQVLGAMTSQGIEPLSYSANGSFSVMSFVNKSDKQIPPVKPDAAVTGLDLTGKPDIADDNTLGSAQNFIHETQFTPRKILMSSTFDIDIVEKPVDVSKDYRVIYKLVGCRLTDWSLGFSPGQLASERYGFVCERIVLEDLATSTAALAAQVKIDEDAAKAAAEALAKKPK
ncbi:hypothetical protein UFOVP244_186 [uncultured Caudovirales phage]|uniref:Uncharacterized protein n=1 Tax=uncultured Caudovirales phage TaxID=2100421 RepID=A0A6J7WXC4_9CAUD|nr:hypothetical protein UFOVP244_186 [uncultured Caudovirales phage]